VKVTVSLNWNKLCRSENCGESHLADSSSKSKLAWSIWTSHPLVPYSESSTAMSSTARVLTFLSFSGNRSPKIELNSMTAHIQLKSLTQKSAFTFPCVTGAVHDRTGPMGPTISSPFSFYVMSTRFESRHERFCDFITIIVGEVG
jgi:hypothetical protein